MTWRTNHTHTQSAPDADVAAMLQLESIENHYRHIIGIDISKIALPANLVNNNNKR